MSVSILVCHDCGREFGEVPVKTGVIYDTCPQCQKKGKREMREELRKRLPTTMTDDDMKGLMIATVAAMRSWHAETLAARQVTLHLNLPVSKERKRLNAPKKPRK